MFKTILEQHKEAFQGMEGIETTVDTLSTKLKELGYNFVIDNTKEPGYIPKARFDEVIDQKNQLKTQTGELASQLEELKKAAKGNDELTKQIEELQRKNDDADNKLKAISLESAIKLAALTAKAKDAADILAFVDKSKLELAEDGTVKGLEEQLKALQEAKSYLFETAGGGKGGSEFDKGNPPPTPLDFRTATPEQFAAEAAKYGIKL